MSERLRELRRTLRRARETARRLRDRVGMSSRRKNHLAAAALGRLRVEIGSGGFPTPGYFHVDTSWRAHHLEAVAPMWDLPLPSSCAIEVRAIHSLEHVEPRLLLPTLAEWRRVLVPGGIVHISVPNGSAIMAAFEAASVPDKWPLMSAILGTYGNQRSRAPDAIQWRSDHQIVFDHDVLVWALAEAGFHDIVDLTDNEDDRHSLGWRPLVDRFSLIMRASA